MVAGSIHIPYDIHSLYCTNHLVHICGITTCTESTWKQIIYVFAIGVVAWLTKCLRGLSA